MEPRSDQICRLGIEGLEDRSVPASCQGFGQHVAEITQTFEPNLGAVVSFIAGTAPGALADQVVADKAVYC